MDATSETAVEVGRELSRIVQHDGGLDQSEAIRDLVVRLIMAESRTTADAMVLTNWSASLLKEAAELLPDGIPGVDGDVRFVLNVCASLLFRATHALEQVTGTPAGDATGEANRLH